MRKQEEISAETQFHLLSAIFATDGWALILRHWNHERERMIAEGKANRSEEKGKKMWAALDGFDRAALLPERILKACQKIEQVETNLEDE